MCDLPIAGLWFLFPVWRRLRALFVLSFHATTLQMRESTFVNLHLELRDRSLQLSTRVRVFFLQTTKLKSQLFVYTHFNCDLALSRAAVNLLIVMVGVNYPWQRQKRIPQTIGLLYHLCSEIVIVGPKCHNNQRMWTFLHKSTIILETFKFIIIVILTASIFQSTTIIAARLFDFGPGRGFANIEIKHMCIF